jgi:hypothetical protein
MIYGFIFRNTNNPEPLNKNLTFVGNNNSSYTNCKTFQNPDSTIIIASVMTKISSPHQKISIMKLSSVGKHLWEHEFRFSRFSLWDIVPAILRRNKGMQYLNIQGINLVDDKYFLLVNRFNGKVSEPFILTLDKSGKLLNSKRIDLELSLHASTKTFMQNNYAYMAYLDLTAKMLCLAKIDVKTSDILINPMLFYKQDSLYINAITVDKNDEMVSLTAYDSKVGCSFYAYTKDDDLKEYFRTEPTSEFTVLKYIGDKLYGVVKEDSLMRVVDLTSLSRPLIVFSDTPEYVKYKARDITIVNNAFYIAYDVDNPSDKDYRNDVALRKYTSAQEKPVEHLFQGKGYEAVYKIYTLQDKHLVVIGSSSSMSLNKGLRIFATKVAL